MPTSTLSQVSALDYHTDNVVAELEETLRMAKAGEIKSVAIVYEYLDGKMGHTAAFGDFANPNAAVVVCTCSPSTSH